MPPESSDPIHALRRYAGHLRRAAEDETPPRAVAFDGARSGAVPRGRMLRPAPALAAVLVMALLAGTGTLVAADAAVPGDALYGVDILLEDALWSGDHAAERFEEASVLFTRGELSAGVGGLIAGFREVREERWAATGLLVLVEAEHALLADPELSDMLLAPLSELASSAGEVVATGSGSAAVLRFEAAAALVSEVASR